MPRFFPLTVFAWFAFSFVLTLPLFGQNSVEQSKLKKFAYTTPAMGVNLNIVVYCTDDQVEATIKAAVDAVVKVNDVFSDYSAVSEVGRLNSAGGGCVDVSDEFLDLFEKARSISEKTNGNFDVTLGALTKEWRIARKENRLPTSAVLLDALSVSGIDKVEVDLKRKQIHLPKGLQFDFGGIGKGYAADRALDAMTELGFGSALVDLGGDLAIGNPPPGKEGWKVAIAARPLETRSVDSKSAKRESASPQRKLHSPAKTRFIEVSNCGVATSGDVEQFVEVEGVRYSHLLNPKTGLGIQRQANVTIFCDNACLADALASAYSVMPYEAADKNRTSFANAKLLVQEMTDGKVVERLSGDFPKVEVANE